MFTFPLCHTFIFSVAFCFFQKENIMFLTTIGFLIILYVFYRSYRYFFPTPNINPNGKYVLVSGCDTGFGHGLAIELDKQGFNVLAGVLVPDNVTSLKNKLSSKATVFRLDITKQEDIDAAYDLVKDKTNTLYSLVNNAGVGQGGNIDWITLEFMHRIMDVNFFGHVAMTKRFLPLLIAKRNSRVVNICSVMGLISPPTMSAYCASKYAFESFSDCLRREMFPWGLRVSIIEPGWLRTPIIQGHDRLLRELWKGLPFDVRERWGEEFLNDLIAKSVTNSPFINNAEDPMKVVRALQHAVMNTEPCIRYRPDWQGKLIFFPASMLPAWLTDLILLKLASPSILPAGVNNQIED
jgi:NAD(P)-dependent dehydrogenase (short-subunit alcohol dehydrogenase family)